MNEALLLSKLKPEEGFRDYPYDDYNGKRLYVGDCVQGTVTIGYGFTFLTEEEASVVLSMRAKSVFTGLINKFPWVSNLSDARQVALIDLSYNLGLAGLSSFNTFLQLMKDGKYNEAADDLLQTKWATQVKSRATNISDLIRKG